MAKTNNRLSPEQVSEVVRLSHEGYIIAQIHARFPFVCRRTIWRMISMNGGKITGNRRTLTKENADYISHEILVKNKKIKDIAKEFGMGKGYLVTKMKNDFNIDIGGCYSKYEINQNFFETIDNEHKAYWLGFLYADGNISLKRRTVKVNLNMKDIKVLEDFKKDLEYTGIISFIEPREVLFTNGNNSYIAKQGRQARLDITNKKIINDLIDKGCIPKKSLILKFPTESQVPNHLIRHFIRGYFDGDGSIFLHKQTNNYGVSVISTLDFCNHMASILKNELQLNCKIEPRVKVFYLRIGGNRNTKIFCDWLYKNATIFLERKHNKYLNLIKLITTIDARKTKELWGIQKRSNSSFRVCFSFKRIHYRSKPFKTLNETIDYLKILCKKLGIDYDQKCLKYNPTVRADKSDTIHS